MILGMTTFTFVHVVLSLIGIFSGLMVMFGLFAGKAYDRLTLLFLTTTIATSVTGFMFPYHGFTPGIGIGILSLIILAVTLEARYRRHLAGAWRRTYVISAVIALYLNVFVLVVQLFEKVPSLHALAPKGSEPPFAITQGVVLLLFVAIGIFAVRGFKERPVAAFDRRSRAA